MRPEIGEVGIFGFWQGKIACWQMCHCPDVIRNECPAPKYPSFPCWEIEGTYCKLSTDGTNGSNTSICRVCRVYKRWGGNKPIELKLFGKGVDSLRRSLEERTKEKEKPFVLVVDDEAIVRESLRDWLIDDGFQVVTAEDGEQALEVIGRQEFSIALLDLKLPGKDGIEVLKEAKRERPHLKAIIITAYPSTETAVEAKEVGAMEYVTKPFSPDTIERLIREALKG